MHRASRVVPISAAGSQAGSAISRLHTAAHGCKGGTAVCPYLSGMLSTTSLSLRMSHHRTCPSVDTVSASLPVLDCSQAKSNTGSLQTHTTARGIFSYVLASPCHAWCWGPETFVSMYRPDVRLHMLRCGNGCGAIAACVALRGEAVHMCQLQQQGSCLVAVDRAVQGKGWANSSSCSSRNC